jgi:hypothetical protein
MMRLSGNGYQTSGNHPTYPKEGQLDIKIRVSLSKSRKNPDQIIWVCQYYSTIINATLLKVGGKALYNITNATSAAPLI